MLALVASMASSFGPSSVAAIRQDGNWHLPDCNVVLGSGAVTFTRDRGSTLTPAVVQLQGVGYTAGLVALDAPNVLLATFNATLLRSTDAGCFWTELSTLRLAAGNPLVTLAAAPGGRAYGWTQNGPDLIRIDDGEVVYLKSPTGSISGLGTDRADRDHLRLGDEQGRIWESRDGGMRWDPLGAAPVPAMGVIVYGAVFDPGNLDHALVGVTNFGALVTTDGGTTWQTSTGLSRGGNVNVFNLVIAPSNGSRVWAMGLDLSEPDKPAAFSGRHIYVSHDAGRSFISVIDASPEVTLVNGPLMAVPPDNPDLLYFVFGSSFQDYGTDLFRYDFAARALAKTHNPNDDIWSIAFSPADPELIYLGLAVEIVTFCAARYRH